MSWQHWGLPNYNQPNLEIESAVETIDRKFIANAASVDEIVLEKLARVLALAKLWTGFLVDYNDRGYSLQLYRYSR